ncbi:uncharacterized protein LOC113273255 [Papaver somniferum]|uniref:uncharacterized protein LOC113273255 n=1 Tax=Papaver somniferum TaxID=3469 RepID=UPI000E6FCDCE|nr:uncharacterized protein LOC113273255 [Papaver somniferum]
MLDNGRVARTAWQIFVKIPQRDILCLKSENVVSHQLRTTKATANAFIKISQVKNVEVSCEELKSLKEYVIIIHNKLLVYKLIPKLGYCLDLLIEYSTVFLLVQNGDNLFANYNGKCIIALIFKLGYPLKLLRKSSITFMLVTGVETGVVCKLLDKRLQQGLVLWSRLILQVTYNGISQSSKRLTCKSVFLSLNASKLCHESLQQGIKLCFLNLSLCSVASGIVFTLFFTGIPEQLGSTVCGSNEYNSG